MRKKIYKATEASEGPGLQKICWITSAANMLVLMFTPQVGHVNNINSP